MQFDKALLNAQFLLENAETDDESLLLNYRKYFFLPKKASLRCC